MNPPTSENLAGINNTSRDREGAGSPSWRSGQNRPNPLPHGRGSYRNPAAVFHEAAFTLVELLVVITIIVILLALLTPALETAIDQTERTQCLSNLKGIGTAVTTYVSEQKAYPISPGYFQLFGKKTPDLPLDTDQRPLNKYLGFTGPGSLVPIARCPADKGDTRWTRPSSYEAWGSSYHEPAAGWGMSAVFDGRQPFRVSPAHNKILFGDTGLFGDRPITNPNTRWHQRDYKENGTPAEQVRQLNILFADGRAEFFTFDNALVDEQANMQNPYRQPNPMGKYW